MRTSRQGWEGYSLHQGKARLNEVLIDSLKQRVQPAAACV